MSLDDDIRRLRGILLAAIKENVLSSAPTDRALARQLRLRDLLREAQLVVDAIDTRGEVSTHINPEAGEPCP